jgi:hypothetical protein
VVDAPAPRSAADAQAESFAPRHADAGDAPVSRPAEGARADAGESHRSDMGSPVPPPDASARTAVAPASEPTVRPDADRATPEGSDTIR